MEINPCPDGFWFIPIENLLRSRSDSFGQKSRIESDWVGLIFKLFSTNEIQNVFRIGSYWFALTRIQISEWFGIALIQSEHWFIRIGNQSVSGLILIHSNWKFTSYSFGFIWTEVSDWIGLSRIKFQAIFNKLDSKFFSDWFALARIQISEWFGIALIQSDSIQMNPNQSEHWFTRIGNQSVSGLILIHSDWKFTSYSFGFIWTEVSDWIRLSSINSDWFALVRIQISEWFGKVLIG